MAVRWPLHLLSQTQRQSVFKAWSYTSSWTYPRDPVKNASSQAPPQIYRIRHYGSYKVLRCFKVPPGAADVL